MMVNEVKMYSVTTSLKIYSICKSEIDQSCYIPPNLRSKLHNLVKRKKTGVTKWNE